MTQNILIFTLRGNTFAVREKEVSSVIPAGQLHRLPLSPPSIAGMAIVEERGTTIVDLGVCLDAEPMDGANSGSYLIVGSEDRKNGFWVDGNVDTVPCAAEEEIPLHDLVRTELVDRCTIRNSAVIPIINIGLLQQQISRGELTLPGPATPPFQPSLSLKGAGPVRMFSLGNDWFCVRGEGSVVFSLNDASVRLLPYARKRAIGVLYYDGEIVPLLPVAERLELDVHDAELVLIAVGNDGRYGMMINRDHGLIDPKEFAVLRMPPLVQSPMIGEAIKYHDEVIPAVDVAGMINPAKDAGEPGQLADRYTPNSSFKGRFRKETVGISEVAVFGARHAVPQDEVVEVLKMQSVQRIPQSPAIVLGVRERDKKLLPVLDLAAIFGKRSPVDNSWSQLRIRNGDFEALVAVESILGTRDIGTEVQRQVPIMLPYDVVYGCYLDEGAVRLILNVEALTVHYEKTTIRDFMATVSPFTAEAEAVPEPVSKESLLEAPAVQEELNKDMGLAEEQDAEAPPMMRIPGTGHEATPAGLPQSASASEEITGETPPVAPVSTQEEPVSTPKERPEEELLEEKERKEAEEKLRKEKENEELRHREKERLLLSAEEKARQEERERALIAEEQDRLLLEEERKTEERERIRREEQLRMEQKGHAEEGRLRQEEEQQSKQEEEERLARRKTEAENAASLEKPAPVQEERPLVERMPAGVTRKWRNPARTGAVAVVILLAAVFVLLSLQKEHASPLMPGKTAETEPMYREEVGKKHAQKKEADGDASLVLEVPKSLPVENGSIYIVVKGDTLWGIAKRFTGNPLNYPRVAENNSIATPDLIFPGQTIRLKKE